MDIKVRATEIQRSNSFSFAAGTTRIERWISWTAPIWPWVKLNSNNAKKSSGIAGAGGLIRDFRGVWHVGYSANLGVCSVASAELWGFRRVYVEVDSMCVMKLISNSNPPINEPFTLIQEIQALLRRDWLTKVEHIYREANEAADFLASYNFSFSLGLHCFHSIPPNMLSILINDDHGVANSRLVLT
ncbi:putative ribonuclease H protein [Citrus sinensis]|nr:putative ribonuclease H protein [Citrus sinensis]